MTSYSYERPWLYDKQRDAIFTPERVVVIEASTKVGQDRWLLDLADRAGDTRQGWSELLVGRADSRDR